MLIRVYGTLAFDGGGAKISLPCGSSVIIYPGGQVTANSGGSSQTIKICSDTYWQASDGNVSGPMGWPYNVLPVEVAEFSASNAPEGVVLEWATASESGIDHFELQRSQDLIQWSVAGLVDAAGNSAQLLEYSMVDGEVSRGQWYYRLVQVDPDGDRSGYLVVGIEVQGRAEPLTCTPNPVTDGRIVAIANTMLMEDPRPVIRDLQNARLIGTNDYSIFGDRTMITMPGTASGNYLLEMNVNGERRTCRFLLMR